VATPPRTPSHASADPGLIRGLTSIDAFAIVVGGIIGTGIFLKPAVVAQLVGSPTLLLGAWAAAGLLTLAGALTYAELGALLPAAGGEYVFFRTAFGDGAAFAFGWTRSFTAGGALAAYGVAIATFLAALIPLGGNWVAMTAHPFGLDLHWQFGARQAVAIGFIAAFAGLNCLGVVAGGRAQTAIMVAKLGAIAIIVVGALLWSRDGSWEHLRAPAEHAGGAGVSAFGAAMLASLWAYNGWSFLPMSAGELRDPTRTLPRAIIGGTLMVVVIYLLVNLAFVYALPFSEIQSANSTRYPLALPVGTMAAESFLGPIGARVAAAAFVISTIGALNASTLALSRIPFAMARDGLFFEPLGRVSERTRAPVAAIVCFAAWGSILATLGSFDQLTNLVMFACWIFYGLGGAALIVLRRTKPDAPRPYRVLGYPVVPALLLVAAAWLVANTVRTNPGEAWAALGLMALGAPLYWVRRRQRRTRSDRDLVRVDATPTPP